MSILKFVKFMVLHYDWLNLNPRFVADIYKILKGTNLGARLHFSSDADAIDLSALKNVGLLSKYFIVILRGPQF